MGLPSLRRSQRIEIGDRNVAAAVRGADLEVLGDEELKDELGVTSSLHRKRMLTSLQVSNAATANIATTIIITTTTTIITIIIIINIIKQSRYRHVSL